MFLFDRLIAIAASPYTVVHVNAAYLCMSGLPSARVLGRPFEEVMEVGTLDSDIDSEKFDFLSINELVAEAKTASSESSKCFCKLSVTSIGAALATHFSIEMSPVLNSDERVSTKSTEKGETAISVMG